MLSVHVVQEPTLGTPDMSLHGVHAVVAWSYPKWPLTQSAAVQSAWALLVQAVQVLTVGAPAMLLHCEHVFVAVL